MRVDFVARENGPERMVCEAELVFGEDAGPLSGLKLVGFTLWRSTENEVFVTFPSRAFGAGSDRRYFDFLRSTDGGIGPSRAFKVWILDQYALVTKGRVDQYLATVKPTP
jgi:hypothetical protein